MTKMWNPDFNIQFSQVPEIIDLPIMFHKIILTQWMTRIFCIAWTLSIVFFGLSLFSSESKMIFLMSKH